MFANRFYFLALHLSLKYYSPSYSPTQCCTGMLSVLVTEILFKTLLGREVLDPVTAYDPKQQQEYSNSQLTQSWCSNSPTETN